MTLQVIGITVYWLVVAVAPGAFGFWCARNIRPRHGDAAGFVAAMFGAWLMLILATAFRVVFLGV